METRWIRFPRTNPSVDGQRNRSDRVAFEYQKIEGRAAGRTSRLARAASKDSDFGCISKIEEASEAAPSAPTKTETEMSHQLTEASTDRHSRQIVAILSLLPRTCHSLFKRLSNSSRRWRFCRKYHSLRVSVLPSAQMKSPSSDICIGKDKSEHIATPKIIL